MQFAAENPCHVHGASDYFKVVIAKENLRCSYTPFFKNHLIPVFMKQNFKKAGRHPKIDPTAFRCSVNFTASEKTMLQTMHEKSGVESLSAFIKMQIFGKPFKVFVVDENSRVFIDKLSALNAHYRTISINYDLLLKTLRENFTEKKAMRILSKLEQQTIELVKVNREIVALAKDFDERWLQKSQ